AVVLCVLCAATSGVQGQCIVVQNNAWDAGWDGSLEIPVTTTVSAWTIDIEFDVAPTEVLCWVGVVSPSGSSDTYSIDNEGFDGDQPAGSTFSLPLQYHFATGSQMPLITSVSWNGDVLCSG
ncbi:unnamed protein product, partial [Meganyctiphanes norvegica]